MPNIFEEVRTHVSIADAIVYLGLKASETKGDQLRFPCPACKGSDRRTLSVNLQKGFRCFSSDKRGDDATALVAHVRDIRNGEAAQLLKDHFISAARTSSATKPRQTPEPGERLEAFSDVLQPLDYLEHEHPVAEMLGLTPGALEALGGGFAPRGTMAGRVLIPLRLPNGDLLGYCGIATREDQSPLLLFPKNIEERCQGTAEKPEPDQLRKLFRVVS
jgi:hypothetical protein